jgi:hypothetical protein
MTIDKKYSYPVYHSCNCPLFGPIYVQFHQGKGSWEVRLLWGQIPTPSFTEIILASTAQLHYKNGDPSAHQFSTVERES